MQRTLLTYNNRKPNQSDVFNIHPIQGNFNPPQMLKIYPNNCDSNIYEFVVTDAALEGISNIGINLDIPEIKGIGGIRYPEDFIYKSIKKFDIFINNELILSKSGEELCWEYYNKNNNNTYTEYIKGNNSQLCKFKYGKTEDDIIFDRTTIYAKLITAFDYAPPKSILRIPPSAQLKFIINMRHISEIMYYNKEFKQHSFKKIQLLSVNPCILLTAYNTLKEPIFNRYIEQLYYYKDITSSSNINSYYVTPEFNSITNLLFYPITDNFIDKTFVTYPDYQATEDIFIKTYVMRILEDLIQIKSNYDDTKMVGFTKLAKFVEVSETDGYMIHFNTNNACKVIIMNIPDGYKIYYHTNILTFNRRMKQDTYNISEKFSYILGYYIKEENRIMYFYDFIKHNITISDVSIPIEKWNSEENTATKDQRSKQSKNKDVIINDPFIYGYDFISKESGIEQVIIKQGISDTILDHNNYDSLKYYQYNIDNIYPITILGKHMYSCVDVLRFNVNNYLLFEPSRMVSDKSKNFRSCGLHVMWKKFDDNDPRSLIPKSLCVGITIIKQIKYDNNTVKLDTID